jgi:TRAP-type C4-dicarboxylate transport system substrate-binding protein
VLVSTRRRRVTDGHNAWDALFFAGDPSPVCLKGADVGHQSTTMFVFSAARFNTMPAELRTLIRAITPEAVQAGLDFHNSFGDDALVQVRARGIAVTEPAIGRFREASRRSWDGILADAGANGRALATEIEAARTR